MKNAENIKKANVNEAVGQYALYHQQPKLYSPEGHLVVSIPIRHSNYTRFQAGDFFTKPDSDVSAVFLDYCYPGDIVCIHTGNLDGAWLYTNKGWKKLNRFSPEDLPWKN